MFMFSRSLSLIVNVVTHTQKHYPGNDKYSQEKKLFTEVKFSTAENDVLTNDDCNLIKEGQARA